MAERSNPESLYDSVKFGFSHGAISEGKLLHCAGQTSMNEKGEPVFSRDLAAQTQQCLANLTKVLEAHNATPADIVRIRTYVVNHTPACLSPVTAELLKWYGNDVTPAPNTWIGVQALAFPEFMIEIEATVALK